MFVCVVLMDTILTSPQSLRSVLHSLLHFREPPVLPFRELACFVGEIPASLLSKITPGLLSKVAACLLGKVAAYGVRGWFLWICHNSTSPSFEQRPHAPGAGLAYLFSGH